MRLLTVLVTLALVATFAAGLAETGDFPDECFGYEIAEVGEAIQGTVDHDDEVDHIGLNVTEDDVGNNVTVEFVSDTYHIDFAVYTPDCGQDVVPLEHQACTVSECPKGHTHTDGAGHHQCQANGHVMECSGAGDGVQDEDSVAFTPDAAGVYVVIVSFDAKSFKSNNAGGNKDDPCRTNDCSCIECDQICSETCVDSSPQSSPGGSSGGGKGGVTIQNCHLTCGSRSIQYDIATSSDSETVTFVS